MNRQVKVSERLVEPHYASAFFLGLIGYLILSLREPLAWTMPVWIGLAFVGVPVMIGFTVSKSSLVRSGATAAYFVASLLMFVYTAINLMRTHAKIASGDDAGQIFFVGLVASLVYGVAAGLIASGIYLLRSRRAGS